jgi:hypothetical protein
LIIGHIIATCLGMLGDIELDDREVENFLKAATCPREELVYRLALRDLCPRL